MAKLFSLANCQGEDANGNPYAGAKLYFYTTGTTTPLAVYADTGLTTPLSNPVVADSAGFFVPIFMQPAIYRVDYKTSADVLIQPVVNGYDPGQAIGSGALAVTLGGTGATTAAQARINLGIGTSSTVNTGTSGATIPLNNGNNTSSGNNTYSGTSLFSGIATFSAAPVFSTTSAFTGVATFTAAPIGTGAPDIQLEEQQVSGTQGGTFTSGADRTRILNTEVRDARSECSLATNQFTLTAGTYWVEASAPGFTCAAHQILVYNVTGAAELLRGTSEQSAGGSQTRATISGLLTVAAAQALELRHRCGTTRATDGLGSASSLGTERYSVVKLWRLS